MKATYYLNKTGSRCVTYENGKLSRHTFTASSGKQVSRAILFEEAFGNFGVMCISWKGKKIKVFPDNILED